MRPKNTPLHSQALGMCFVALDGEAPGPCGEPGVNELLGDIDCLGTTACDAATGFDGPSGVGTPRGLGAFKSNAVTEPGILGGRWTNAVQFAPSRLSTTGSVRRINRMSPQSDQLVT
jgi:hypothetical protein